MKPTEKLNTTQQFFFDHGGYSYDPKTETPEQGRTRCAIAMAVAESNGREAGLSFEWLVDTDCDSSEFSNKKPAWKLWCCLMREESGLVVGSLGAIDFGRDGSPWSDKYRRVVEAGMADEYFSEVLAAA